MKKFLSVLVVLFLTQVYTVCYALDDIPKRYVKKFNTSVPFLGLGTVELGRDWGIGGNKSLHPTEEKAKNILRTAIANHLTVIDTASSYQLSEERIGKYLPQKNHHYLLITKPGEHSLLAKDHRCKTPTYDGIYCKTPGATYDFSKAAIIKDVNDSLQKLKVKQIDVALLHLDSKNALEVLKSGKALDTLKFLRSQGKVKFIGVSINGPAAGYAIQHLDIDAIELEYNLLNQSNKDYIAMAHKKGLAVIIRGGLATGLLTPYVAKHINDPKLPFGAKLRALVKLVDYDYNKLPALALAFLYKNPNISTVIIGADNPNFIPSDIDALKNFKDDKLLSKSVKLMKQFATNDYYSEIMGEFYA